MNAKQRYKNITLGEWLAEWFITYKRPYLRPYSLRNIEQMIRLHTPAWLKAMRMRDICVLDLDKALAELPNGRTMQYARQTWHNAFAKACKLGIIERNVVDLTDAVKYKKKRGNPLNVKERRDFLEAIKGKRFEWLMKFYILTGVRRSEALTLEWSDIDEDERLILIRGTKTEGSYRSILLTDEIKNISSKKGAASFMKPVKIWCSPSLRSTSAACSRHFAPLITCMTCAIHTSRFAQKVE